MDIKTRTNSYRQKVQDLLNEIELDEKNLPEGEKKDSIRASKEYLEDLFNAFTHIIDGE